MTGRDLIIYILMNNLEDEEVFKNGRILGFISETEAAEKLNVGTATVRAWIQKGYLKATKFNDIYYIPNNFSIFGQQMD